MKNMAKNYVKGKFTISEAAHSAGLTVWEMEKFLIDRGFVSSYSVEDFEKQLKLLGSK